MSLDESVILDPDDPELALIDGELHAAVGVWNGIPLAWCPIGDEDE